MTDKLGQYNALVLAYLGDAVLEVLVRDYLVLQKNILKPNDLQKQAIRYVSGKSQAEYMKAAKKNGWLDDNELSWYRRGRNSKGRKNVKNMDVATHNESSGFEAIIGSLYLLEKNERIQEIFTQYCQFIEAQEK